MNAPKYEAINDCNVGPAKVLVHIVETYGVLCALPADYVGPCMLNQIYFDGEGKLHLSDHTYLGLNGQQCEELQHTGKLRIKILWEKHRHLVQKVAVLQWGLERARLYLEARASIRQFSNRLGLSGCCAGVSYGKQKKS
jgi:hypothetical protein